MFCSNLSYVWKRNGCGPIYLRQSIFNNCSHVLMWFKGHMELIELFVEVMWFRFCFIHLWFHGCIALHSILWATVICKIVLLSSQSHEIKAIWFISYLFIWYVILIIPFRSVLEYDSDLYFNVAFLLSINGFYFTLYGKKISENIIWFDFCVTCTSYYHVEFDLMKSNKFMNSDTDHSRIVPRFNSVWPAFLVWDIKNVNMGQHFFQGLF